MNRFAGLRWSVVSLGVLLAATAQAQATVGRTAGDAGVTATGAARYAIPLTLPPGTNGLAPSLGIVYDSRAGNGLLGVGFRLAGLSSIRRCGNTLVQDGKISAVALDATDRFCLDGERLRLTSGSYGTAGSRYQTEVETFARVTAYGTAGTGPAYFLVEKRDGLIYEYGATGDSRVESAGSTTAREWTLNRIRDRNGNHADFVYAEDTAAGSHRPSRIDYAGNLSTGATPYYSVRFTYEARPAVEQPSGYVADGPLGEATRLDRIEVVHIGTSRAVRSFDLGYEASPASGRSRLASLRECAGATCLPATQFGWTAAVPGWGSPLNVSMATAAFRAAIPGDMDGDGYDDLAYHDSAARQWMLLRGGAGGFQYPAVATGLGQDSDPSQAISADLDGDGRRDVLVPGSGTYWHRLRWTASGTYAYNAIGVTNPAPPGGLIATDIDGDGRDDLVYVKAGGEAIYWRRNQTTGPASFAAEAALWTVPANTRLPAAPFVETAQRFRSIVRRGDVNGDGRSDLLVLAQQANCAGSSGCTGWTNRWIVLASNGSALVPQYSYDGNTESLLGDFNGDGLTDIGYWAAGGAWQLLYGTGTRGVTLATFAGPYATAAAAPPAGGRAMVVDWDADGRADLLQPASSGELRYCRSTGRTLEACQVAGIVPGTATSSPMTLDVNGDDLADLAYVASGVQMDLHHATPPDLLASVTDGLGARSGFEYAPITNTAVHRPAGTAVYPVRHQARLGQVVSRMTRAASDGPQTESYYYEGAKMHVQGRGFLGFARRVVTPANGNPIRAEEYAQDPAAVERIGAPTVLTLQQRSGAPLARTTFTWGRQTFGSGYETRSLAVPASVRVERFELDGTRVSSTVTTSIFDSFGTPTQRQTVTTEHAKGLNPGAQHTETVLLGGVVNDTINWCLNRPASTQVTRQHTLPGGGAVTRTTGHTWDYLRCRATQQVIEPSSTTLKVTSDFAYDSYGNPSSLKVTPVGQAVRSTTYAWTQNGRFPGTEVNAEGHVTGATWDVVFARPGVVTDANGLASSLQYDELGRVLRESRPDGTSTVFTRSSCGASCVSPSAVLVVTASRRAVGDVVIASSETGYDAYGRVVYSTADQPGGTQSLQVRAYDSRGLLAQESVPSPCCIAPAQWVRHGYDDLGRRTSTERPTGEGVPTPAVTRWRYDGLAVTETDVLGRSTTRRHDALGNVLQVVDAALADVDYEYDAFGNLVKIRDFGGSETVVSYDVRGLRRSITDPNAGRRTLDYWPAGELKSQTNARGQVTSYTYDRLGRPVSRTEPEGTTTWTWGTSAVNRNIGALASVSSPGFQEAYQFDGYGRPSTVTTTIAGTSLVTRQTYQAASGLPDVLTYPGATPLRVRHEFDRGRLSRIADADSGATYWRLNGVDGGGQVVDESLGNGVRVLSDYDSVTGRLVSRTAGLGGGSTHQNLGYAWDAAGNLLSREERNRGVREQFYYDTRDRLDYVMRDGTMVLDLGYDDAGNFTYKSDVGTYRYDPTRRQAVVAAGSNTYTYDANGAVATASGTSIDWLSYELPGLLSHPAGNSSSFQYGPDRSRFRQVATAGGVSTETLYAAGGLYERVTTGGVAQHRYYIVADGRRVAVQRREPGKTPVTVYLLEDHLGGVDGFVSESGSLLARTSYQPFGARRSGDWLSNAPTPAEWTQIQAATPRGYTDHEHLDNLGVVHMNGRAYDAVLGRFLSPDPLVQAPYDTQGLNRYAYVRNNPMRYVDPSGMCFYQHTPTDGIEQNCLEVILVEGSGLANRDGWTPMPRPRIDFGNSPQPGNLFGGRPDGGGGSSVPGGAGVPVEEVVVTASRSDAIGVTSSPASVRSEWDYIAQWMTGLGNWRYFDEALFVASLTLALIEPTPMGEAALAAQAARSASGALVPYYPTANGFAGTTFQLTLSRGTLIDRYGGTAYSRFFSPVGTPVFARALPPATAGQSLRTFEVIRPFTVEAGWVSPWFGQIGYGIQYRTPSTLGELLQRQMIREVGP